MAPIMLAYAGLAGVALSTPAAYYSYRIEKAFVRPIVSLMALAASTLIGCAGVSNELKLHPQRHHALEAFFPVMKPK